MIAILDRVKPFFHMDASPLFSPADMDALAATAGVEGQLLGLIGDAAQPLARRFAAVEALSQGNWSAWRSSPAEVAAVASVLGAALPADKIHNRWGLPGHSLGRTGRFLVGLPGSIDEALRPLLGDKRPLSIVGSESATLQEARRYRISDLAAYLLATRRQVQWKDDPSPAVRDLENERIGQLP